LRKQPLFSPGYEPEQPGILVGLGMGGADLRSVDVEPPEDLPNRLFAKPIGNRWVSPERAEVREQLVRVPDADLVRLPRSDRRWAVQSAPCAAKRLDGDLARVQLELQPFPGSHHVGPIGLVGQSGAGTHCPDHLAEVGLVEVGAIEEPGDLLLVTFSPVCGRWTAGRPTGVTYPPVAVAGVTVVRALAEEAAHEANEWVGAPRHRHPGGREPSRLEVPPEPGVERRAYDASGAGGCLPE